MNKMIVAVLWAALCAGCATKEMKSTPFYEGDQVTYVGEASDRVNLWPVAYWRNPVGAVVWPVASFSDDHFAFRPVYSQYKQSGTSGAWDEFNFVWPIAQADTKHNDYHVFPVFWGWDGNDYAYQAVFPLYWNGHDYNALFPLWYYGSGTDYWTFHTLAGLAGAHRTKNDYRCSWTFPLWYEDNAGLFTTLLYGQTKDSHWVFPLWYKGEKAFVSPLYAQGADGKKSWWSVPLGLSWGTGSSGAKSRKSEGKILFGFGGWENREDSDGYRHGDWWAFPFVQREWTQPEKAGAEQTTETYVVDYLAGWKTCGDDMKSLYIFPLFSWDADGSWLTLLGGQLNRCGTTNTLYTPLVGIKSGTATGGWAFPVWWHEKDVDFDERLALIDAPTFPDCIPVAECTNDFKNSSHFGERYLTGRDFSRSDETVVLLHDADHSIRGWCGSWSESPTNEYEIGERRKRGNKLLMNYEFERTVTFDLKTKAKLSDKEESEASFLVWLYQYEYNRDRMKGGEYARHRVLWRLWDWEEKDGDVALDIFPGFTYDRRTDGYAKTSFLWRLFRNEHDPKNGRKVDVLFIPVWR